MKSIRKSAQNVIAFSLALFPLTAGAQVAHDLPVSPLYTPLVVQLPAARTPSPTAELSIVLHPQPEPVTPLIVLTPEQLDTLLRQQRLGAQAEAAGLGDLDPALLTQILTWLGGALQAPPVGD